MSYSFNFQGASKAEAIAKVISEMEKVVQGQPVHAKDRDLAQNTAGAFISLLADDDTKDVAGYMSGSLSWEGADGAKITSANVNVSASLRNREVPK